MKAPKISMTDVLLIGVTRGMMGAGAALLLSDKLPRERRQALGWALFLTGAISTIPLARGVLSDFDEQSRERDSEQRVADVEERLDNFNSQRIVANDNMGERSEYKTIPTDGRKSSADRAGV